MIDILKLLREFDSIYMGFLISKIELIHSEFDSRLKTAYKLNKKLPLENLANYVNSHCRGPPIKTTTQLKCCDL